MTSWTWVTLIVRKVLRNPEISTFPEIWNGSFHLRWGSKLDSTIWNQTYEFAFAEPKQYHEATAVTRITGESRKWKSINAQVTVFMTSIALVLVGHLAQESNWEN